MIPSVKFLFILNQYFVILLSKNMGNEISFLWPSINGLTKSIKFYSQKKLNLLTNKLIKGQIN